MSELISGRLKRRIRDQGSAPLITYYDLVTGSRTEMSAITFGNWADKTSNLLVDELMLDEGDTVDLAVARTDPGHWVTLAWVMACWQVGLTVTVGHPSSARLVVSGPDWSPYGGAVELVACSLHPLGLGFTATLPPGVVDFALEVRGQPDAYAATPQSGLAAAWHDDDRQLTQADLVASVPTPGRRRLVRPSDPWTTVSTALLEPLLTGGSTVVVAGPQVTGPNEADRIARIASDERVTSS